MSSDDEIEGEEKKSKNKKCQMWKNWRLYKMVTNLNSKKELTSRNSKKKRIDDKIEDRSNVENLGDRLA